MSQYFRQATRSVVGPAPRYADSPASTGVATIITVLVFVVAAAVGGVMAFNQYGSASVIEQPKGSPVRTSAASPVVTPVAEQPLDELSVEEQVKVLISRMSVSGAMGKGSISKIVVNGQSFSNGEVVVKQPEIRFHGLQNNGKRAVFADGLGNLYAIGL